MRRIMNRWHIDDWGLGCRIVEGLMEVRSPLIVEVNRLEQSTTSVLFGVRNTPD